MEDHHTQQLLTETTQVVQFYQEQRNLKGIKGYN